MLLNSDARNGVGTMLQLLFDLFIGRYAGVTAGILGILGSLALAVPPIRSANLRHSLLQLDQIGDALSEASLIAARKRLTAEARKFLATEMNWNLAGAIQLVGAFVVLLANSIFSAL